MAKLLEIYELKIHKGSDIIELGRSSADSTVDTLESGG
jgi:hypothetical protein